MNDAQIAWVSDTLGHLTPEQKVGQLFCVLGDANTPEGLADLVEHWNIGGVLFRPNPRKEVKDKYIYIRYIQNMTEDEILPGAKDFLLDAKAQGYRIALGSASKNTALILQRLHLTEYFDAVIDGTKVSKAKPDPEVFVQGAVALGVSPEDCIAFEDAVAGIQAAHAGGMAAVGIGSKEALPEADYPLPGFAGVTIQDVEAGLAK